MGNTKCCVHECENKSRVFVQLKSGERFFITSKYNVEDAKQVWADIMLEDRVMICNNEGYIVKGSNVDYVRVTPFYKD